MAQDEAERFDRDFPYSSIDDWLEGTKRSVASENPRKGATLAKKKETPQETIDRLEGELEQANDYISMLELQRDKTLRSMSRTWGVEIVEPEEEEEEDEEEPEEEEAEETEPTNGRGRRNR